MLKNKAKQNRFLSLFERVVKRDLSSTDSLPNDCNIGRWACLNHMGVGPKDLGSSASLGMLAGSWTGLVGINQHLLLHMKAMAGGQPVRV